MSNEKVSIIIPARNEIYLEKTIQELVSKAVEEIEIIVMLDGYWPNPPLKSYDPLTIVHFTEAQGMRPNINAAAKIATGKYLIKIDAHCMVDKGYDKILKESCEENCMVVPSRYRLDAENWKLKSEERIEYLQITFPYIQDEKYGYGMHGKKWIIGTLKKSGYYWHEINRRDTKIDDIIAFQGSMWLCHRERFLDLGGLYTGKHGDNFHQEAQELTFKFWLSGGKVVVNKNTWYAHWHKENRGYPLSKSKKITMENYFVWYWMNNKWPKQIHDMKWLVDKFMPMPGWPEDWEVQKKIFEEQHPELCNFDEE